MENLLLEASINNMLTDSVGMYKQKYAKYVDNAEKAFFESTGRKMGTNLVSTLVKNLKATEDFLGERGYLKEETTPTDINAFIHHAFDMISAIIPGNVIEEFATIQGMEKRVGEIFFMDIIKANDKAPANAGDNYLSSQYGPNTGQNYSDERVLTEVIDTVGNSGVHSAIFTDTLTWHPIKPAMIEQVYDYDTTGATACTVRFNFTYGGDTYVGYIGTGLTLLGFLYKNGTSFVATTSIVDTATVVLATGVVTITFNSNAIVDTATYVTCDYDYASTTAPAYNTSVGTTGVGLPEVDIKVTSEIVTAKRRALKTKWLLDTAAMLSKEHGKDIEAELLDAVIAGVMNEIAVEAASDIYNGANAGTAVEFSITPPSTQIPYIVHRQELLGQIMIADTNIESAVRKVKANFVIGGANFTNVVRGMPVDMFKPASYADAVPVGMHVIGTLNGQYKIIQNFDFNANVFVVGAKGNSWLLTGYVYAPFIPIMTTKPITDENLNTFRSLLTWYGKKMVNTKFYNKGLITA